MKRLLLGLVVTMMVACGSDGPTGPTGDRVANVAGLWSYSSTLSSVGGNTCLTDVLSPSVGARQGGTMTLTQNGATVTGTTRDTATGTSCQWSGTAGTRALSLSWTYCDVIRITGIRCLSGVFVDAALVADSLTATINQNSATGSEAATWNVLVSGTTIGVGTLTTNATLSATR